MFGRKKLKKDISNLEGLVLKLELNLTRYTQKFDLLKKSHDIEGKFVDMLLKASDFKRVYPVHYCDVHEQRETLKKEGYEFFGIVEEWEFWKKK